ncbi:MAG: alpha/beta fold hydrolase, partial [Myxococcota bacterium]
MSADPNRELGLTWSSELELDTSALGADPFAGCDGTAQTDPTQDKLCYFHTRGEFSSFTSRVTGSNRASDVRINYAVFRPESGIEDAAIVFVTGRTESYVKYAEFVYDLMHRNSHLNYTLYMIDHRGQGLSSRLLVSRDPAGDDGSRMPVASTAAAPGGADDPHHHRGFVYAFDDFVVDLKTFIDEVVHADAHRGKVIMIAHSMGGGIATRYLQQHGADGQLTGAILTSPMNQILALDNGSGGFIDPDQAKQALVCGAALTGNGWRYTLGGSDWSAGEFATNPVTSSQARFDHVNYLNSSVPHIKLGAATNRWACESFKATGEMRKPEQAAKMDLPIVLFQAEADQIVGAQGQKDVCDGAPNCLLDVVAGAEHEP